MDSHNKSTGFPFLLALLFGMGLGYGNLFAQAPDTLWSKVYGGADEDVAFSVQETSDGGFIVAGYTTSFGAGGQDVYLIKTDGNGNALWTRTYGGTNNDIALSVQQTSDGGYIVVGYTVSSSGTGRDVYLLKLDASGDTLWTQSIGGTGADQGNAVRETTDGGFIISGGTRSSGAGAEDVYLVKTDSAGNLLWSQTFGGTDSERGTAVQQTSDGGFIVAGWTWSFGAGGIDVYLIKTDTNGTAQWTKTYGGFDNDQGFSVQQTTDGGYIVVGKTLSFGTGGDVYLVKTDANGDTLWTRTYGDFSSDVGYSVQQTADGGFVVTGLTYLPGTSGSDVFLFKTDSNGIMQWSKALRASSLDNIGYSVQQTSDGGYIIAGVTEPSAVNPWDVYLIRVASDVVGIHQDQGFTGIRDWQLEAFPNPFNPSTTLRYTLPRGGWVTLKVYNILGQEVARLVDANQPAGAYQVEFSASNLPGGKYLVRLEADGYTLTRKLTLVK